jgi:molybdenum cofactor cytidylyltransferase
MRVAAVVPAAGISQRMGCLKQALPFGNRTVLQTVAAALIESGADPVVVVLNPAHPHLAALVEDSGAVMVLNPLPELGMGSSIACGLKSDHLRDADACLILPGDCPQVRTGDITAVISAAEAHPEADFVVAVHRGRRGHPLLIRERCFASVMHAAPEVGLNHLVRHHSGHVMEVPVSEDALKDLDTPEDYERALNSVP